MTRKVFGPKSITHLIYGLLMVLPFLAIGVKCAYVSVNKNAKESYYGETINNYQSVNVNNAQELNNSTIVFNNSSLIEQVNTYGTLKLSVSNIQNVNGINLTNCKYINLYSYSSNDNLTMWAQSIDVNNNLLQSVRIDVNVIYFQCDVDNVIISTNSFNYSVFKNSIYKLVYNNYSYLDNAFDYSISQVIDENNGFVPKNDFVSLLNGVFSTNSNHLYLRFTNWYLNYALLISTIYILFLAMLWFVNLCRNILEKSMNIGNGVD